MEKKLTKIQKQGLKDFLRISLRKPANPRYLTTLGARRMSTCKTCGGKGHAETAHDLSEAIATGEKQTNND
jgi:hypothetical protein